MRHRDHHRSRGSRPAGEKIYIYGKNPLVEALTNAPQAIRKVFLSPEVNDPVLRDLLKKRNIVPGVLKSREMSQMVGRDTVHQGVIAVADSGALLISYDRFIENLFADGRRIGPETMLVLLDELTDPHNVGAIIRSAAAFGAAAVLLPSHNQAPITGAVVKSSAGMAFRIPIVSIGNVNQTVDALRKEGFRTYGLIMNGPVSIVEEPFKEPTLFIVGNEGAGIREKTLERCEVKLRIPMNPRAESLNASVSAAVVLYQWSVKHPPQK